MPRTRSALLALVLICLLLHPFRPGTASGQAAGKGNKIPETVQKALDYAERFTLYSLQPKRDPNGFHGWAVLGKTEIKSKATRKRVVAALAKGAAEKGLAPARCFIPRHGVQVTRKGQTVGLVICFECYQVHGYVDGKQNADFLIGRSPQTTLDKILKKADIPLAGK
jgi:hypothetical protein